MSEFHHPSQLEMQVLSVLWYSGPSTVAAVCESMPDGKDRAYTTILTVLQNLDKKGHICKENSGRAYVYEAALPKKLVLAKVLKEFVLNVFGGRQLDAILALIDSGVLSADEKAKIQELLESSKTRIVKQPRAKAKATKNSKTDEVQESKPVKKKAKGNAQK